MENDTMKLSVKRLPKRCGIVFYPVNTDVQLSLKRSLARGGKIKSDDVCIIIVLQEVAVDPKQMLVTAKNNVE